MSFKVDGKKIPEPFAFIFELVVWAMIILFWPLIALTHFALRATGRKGIFRREGVNLVIGIDAEAFKPIL